MRDNRALLAAVLVSGAALWLYARRQAAQGLDVFGRPLSAVQTGDPRFMSGQVGMQGTGNTNPIAAALGGITSAVTKLLQGTMAAGGPAQQRPPAGAPTGALNAGGTPTTGLPPGGDVTHDPFEGFDQFNVWSPGQDVWGDSYQPSPGYETQFGAGGWNTGTLPAGYDDFAGLER
jgi:hypothetical protein